MNLGKSYLDGGFKKTVFPCLLKASKLSFKIIDQTFSRSCSLYYTYTYTYTYTHAHAHIPLLCVQSEIDSGDSPPNNTKGEEERNCG